MNGKTIGKWLFLIGLLVAILAGMFSLSFDWLGWILGLLGIVAAFLYFDPNDVGNMGIRFLVLAAVKGALGGIPLIGTYLTGIFTAAVGFLAPVLLTMLVLFFFKKYFGK